MYFQADQTLHESEQEALYIHVGEGSRYSAKQNSGRACVFVALKPIAAYRRLEDLHCIDTVTYGSNKGHTQILIRDCSRVRVLLV